jgi:hypothetical protein
MVASYSHNSYVLKNPYLIIQETLPFYGMKQKYSMVATMNTKTILQAEIGRQCELSTQPQKIALLAE